MPLTPEPSPEPRAATGHNSAPADGRNGDFGAGQPANGLTSHSNDLVARSVEAGIVPEVPPRMSRTWPRRLVRILFAVFAFEVGLFLVVFPWSDRWDINYFQGVIPKIQDFWDEPWFRGALTGLGLVNVYIALLQFVRSFRKR